MNIQHEEFKNKKRRIILLEDANCPVQKNPAIPFEQWLEERFKYWRGSMVDAVIWDMGLESESYRLWSRGSLPLRDYPMIENWLAQGIDWLDAITAKASEYGMDSFWNHRISEIDMPHPFTAENIGLPHDHPCRENYLKKENPDWLLNSWWNQGLWNLANPELRRHKVNVLREIISNYNLSGIQVDFARHTPCLPPDAEWENREHATCFVRMIREMLSEMEQLKKRPLLLLARVAENPEGNHFDGLEVERWLAEGLIDILVPGGRAASVDIAGYRSLPGGDKVKISPCMDAVHTPEGYHRATEDYLRGIFSNWLLQGADSVTCFNWLEVQRKAYIQMLQEGGTLEAMSGKALSYAAESRGEYPWAGNYIYRCDDKILPLSIAHGGGAIIPIEIMGKPKLSKLLMLIEKLGPEDIEEVSLNGRTLEISRYFTQRADHFFGFTENAYPSYPAIECEVPEKIMLKEGRNLISILFRQHVNPVLFIIRRVELHT